MTAPIREAAELKRVLSLGAGVQSTCVLLMSCEGELPKLDCAVFADTGWEPQAVYRHLEWLESVSTVPIHRVSAGNIRADALKSQVRGKKEDGVRWASIPFRVLQPDGSKGMIKRQCTREYKVDVLDKYVRREVLGLAKGERAPIQSVEQWFGISADEMRRVRVSRNRWAKYAYPLIDKNMTRQDCLVWMETHDYPEPVRSACVGCPYKTNAEWRWLKENSPEEWEDACQFDEAMRHAGGMRGDLFIHADYVPLREADVRSDTDKGQGLLFEGCGTCGT